jgi:hypothetical protein
MRKRYIFTFGIAAILFAYVGFIFYSRWRDNRDLVRRLEERKQTQEAPIPESYRGTEIKIISFYAYPGTINAGQKAQLCYGVINADKIQIEPPVEYVWPSLSRCVTVTPKSTTVYRLIAEDQKGNTKKADAKVEVF